MNGKIQYQKASVDMVHAGSLGSQLTYGNSQEFIAKTEMTTPAHILSFELTFGFIGHTLQMIMYVFWDETISNESIRNNNFLLDIDKHIIDMTYP